MVSGTVAQGVIRMVQINNNNCIFEGTIDGLTPGQYALAIHEAGDLSSGCERLVRMLFRWLVRVNLVVGFGFFPQFFWAGGQDL